MARVTLKDIARKAGVSHATVSMALRNQSKISVQTRERIQAIAKEMDYVPDPVLGRLNAYRTKAVETAPRAALAWINHWKKPEKLNQNETFNQYLQGARDMAARLGYSVEEMIVHKDDMTLQRVESILHNRNITGILLPPSGDSRIKSIKMDWDRYSVVKFGYSMSGVNAHLVTNTQFETARLVIRKAIEKGHRRIGYHLNARGTGRTRDNFLGGYLLECNLNPDIGTVEPLVIPGANQRSNESAFLKWFRENKPDCILTQNEEVVEWLANEGIRVPEEVTVFHFALPCPGNVAYSGVRQNSFAIGQQAVSWLDRIMRLGETGAPEKPLELLVQGDWVDGETG